MPDNTPGEPRTLQDSLPGPASILDTTRASILHRFASALPAGGVTRPSAIVLAYLVTVGMTYLPLLVAACLSSLSLTSPDASLKLPFLHDFNVMFMFTVSFPLLVVLTVSDQYVLVSSLERVRSETIVDFAESDAATLRTAWETKFRAINMYSQMAGLVTGLLLAIANYLTYSPPAVGFWIASGDRLLPVGYVFLYCIFVFYALVPVYVARSVAISLFLKDLVKVSQIRILPLHPDKCGGLRPVGQLGLRNQYALSLIGINIVLLIIVSIRHLYVPAPLYGLMIAAAVAYVLLGPIVFMGPFLPFRDGMLRTKPELMGLVARRLRVELVRIRRALPQEPITKDDEELIDRLRKIANLIAELPVWPFDVSTLRKFLTAYVIPLLGAVGYPVLKIALETILPKAK